ncbi:hypothetical protein PMIN01_11588 [Paraphaeosphaeria minitans]|uniref:Uncharacterized protein n=1 Tax=Paraphaeosphaeria minitans TaxID=565426 RepID=A0A9P6KLP5_9PLEO|nr:hypothetical protein PMIN01_11588 [Paraphaeosphaeria minitans]
MNAPDRFELFILDDGQQKIEVREETRGAQHHRLYLQQRRPHARQSHLPAPPQIRLRHLLRIQGSPPALRNLRTPRHHRRQHHTQGRCRALLQGRHSGSEQGLDELPRRVAQPEDYRGGPARCRGQRSGQLLGRFGVKQRICILGVSGGRV